MIRKRNSWAEGEGGIKNNKRVEKLRKAQKDKEGSKSKERKMDSNLDENINRYVNRQTDR